jgi:acetyl esterase/lipase
LGGTGGKSTGDALLVTGVIRSFFLMMRARFHRFLFASWLLAVLAFDVVGPAHAATVPRKLKVFLLAGQSNMEGKGDGAKLTPDERARLKAVQPRIRIAYNHEPLVPLDVITAAPGNKKRFGVDFTFGPELFFGLRVAEAWPNDEILLIKRSVGATSLYGRWNPDWTKEKAAKFGEENAQPLYPDFIGYVREILSTYPRDSYEICGMLWVQGEQDSNVSKNGPEPAESYGRNLQNLIKRVRTDVGVNDLPFLLVQVGNGKVVEGMRTTEQTMQNVTLVPRSMDPASPNFFPQYPVGHYNYEGQKRIGSLLAEAFLKKYANRPPNVVAPTRPPDDAVVYKPTPQGNMRLHFYHPPGWSASDHRPAIMFWCGGAFRTGRAVQFLSQAEYFASRGLVAVHAEYRGTQTEKVPVETTVEDARSAIRWLKAHATSYGIDPQKIIAAGGSAGGSLAMMLAVPEGPDAATDDRSISPRPAALVLFNPAMGGAVLDEIGRGGPEQEAFNQRIMALSAPRADEPPAIFMYGERDAAYLALARQFVERAAGLHLAAEVWVGDGANHGFFNKQPWHDATLRQADLFLAKLGYVAGSPTIADNPAARLGEVSGT